MKILLDIDGVMIPAKSWQTYQMDSDGFGMFSKHAVIGLNRIIKSMSNPEIILTTSHKHKFTLSEWSELFLKRGVIVTKMNRLHTNSLTVSRIEEVKSWYLKNLNEAFIVLDDDKGLNDLDINFKNDHLILTSSSVGLNSLSADEAIKKIELQFNLQIL